MMFSIFPFDIIALIIGIVGENDDTDLLKELALVSHSFHQICSKHLFATIKLQDVGQDTRTASSKKGFVKLLGSRPDVAKYIRKLTYICNDMSRLSSPSQSLNNDDHLLSTILPNLLRTISHLNCLTITASQLDWNTLDSSLTSAFLYLMHLPTINHIDLSYIYNFPLSSLTPSVKRLDINFLIDYFNLELEEDGSPSPKFVVKLESMLKIRDFRTFDSYLTTKKLLHAKMPDGRPGFNFMDLKQLTTRTYNMRLQDERNIRYLFQNAKSLETFQLYNGNQSLVGLHDILSLSARTLKVFDLSVSLSHNSLALPGLREELEAMAGRNIVEAFSFEVRVDDDVTEDLVGSIFREVEEVLVKPGWSASALKQVSFKVGIRPLNLKYSHGAKLPEALQSLPDKYLTHLPKHESIAFNFSAYTSTFI